MKCGREERGPCSLQDRIPRDRDGGYPPFPWRPEMRRPRSVATVAFGNAPAVTWLTGPMRPATFYLSSLTFCLYITPPFVVLPRLLDTWPNHTELVQTAVVFLTFGLGPNLSFAWNPVASPPSLPLACLLPALLLRTWPRLDFLCWKKCSPDFLYCSVW